MSQSKSGKSSASGDKNFSVTRPSSASKAWRHCLLGCYIELPYTAEFAANHTYTG